MCSLWVLNIDKVEPVTVDELNLVVLQCSLQNVPCQAQPPTLHSTSVASKEQSKKRKNFYAT